MYSRAVANKCPLPVYPPSCFCPNVSTFYLIMPPCLCRLSSAAISLSISPHNLCSNQLIHDPKRRSCFRLAKHVWYSSSRFWFSTCTAADKIMSSLCAGANFGAAHESDVQRSPEESMTDRRSHSPHRYPNQPARPQTNQQPASATNGNGKSKPKKRMQNGSNYKVQEPESSDK